MAVPVKIVDGQGRANKAAVDPDGSARMRLADTVSIPNTAFGEILTATLTPRVSLQFPYNVNPFLVTTRLNHGTATVDLNRLKLSTGAGTNRSAELLSNLVLRYQPGQGNRVRFTAIFPDGEEGSEIFVGVGGVSDGFFFGRPGKDFAFIRLFNGSQEMQTLTISTGSSDAESITITLDGDPVSVPVTASGNVTTTANEIGAFDYSNIGTGWFTKMAGDFVEFVSFDAAPHVGTFSLSGATSAVGTFAQDAAGRLPQEEIVKQASWNIDPVDGSVVLEQIELANGNVFDIRYQWLGFGNATGGMENVQTSRIVDVHIIKYAGKHQTPSLNNPTLPLRVFVRNITATRDTTVFVSSMAGFIEGIESRDGIRRGASVSDVAVGTTEIPLITLHNRLIYNGVINRVRVRISLIIGSNESNQTGRLKFHRNVGLTNASFVNVDTPNSVLSIDTSADAVDTSLGVEEFTLPLAKSVTQPIDVDDRDVILNPGDFFTATGVAAGAGASLSVSINVVELF